jgi:membrane protein
MVLGTIGFTVYLRFFSSYNAFYGSLATVIIFLLWAYILMLALAVGVIINMKSYKKHSIKINKNQKKSVKMLDNI